MPLRGGLWWLLQVFNQQRHSRRNVLARPPSRRPDRHILHEILAVTIAEDPRHLPHDPRLPPRHALPILLLRLQRLGHSFEIALSLLDSGPDGFVAAVLIQVHELDVVRHVRAGAAEAAVRGSNGGMAPDGGILEGALLQVVAAGDYFLRFGDGVAAAAEGLVGYDAHGE